MKTTWFDIKEENIEIVENSRFVFLFIGKKDDILEGNINFIHKNPQIESNILIKAILFENSKFNVTGNLIIDKGAKNVDSYLKIDVLLMSERASATAVPGLEITEDDVKGGHGASIGPVDPEQLFYLQSKGLSLMDAERSLAVGFVEDAISRFGDDIPNELENELKKLSF